MQYMQALDGLILLLPQEEAQYANGRIGEGTSGVLSYPVVPVDGFDRH
jgi:hypothetical protein